MSEHSLPHSTTATPMARKLAARAAHSCIPSDRTDDLLLMVTEAVSNAVRHAPPTPDGDIRLQFEADDGFVRASVTDGGSWFVPGGGGVGNGDPGVHFGLKIIDTLSSRWGVIVDGVKTVWFEVDARESQA